MNDILFMMVCPFVAACLLLVVKNDRARAVITELSAVAIIAASVLVAYNYLGKPQMFDLESELINQSMFTIEIILGIAIIYLGIKNRKPAASVLGVAQILMSIYFELYVVGDVDISHTMYIDDLTIVMILIIGIIGSLITVYAVGYMRDFQEHHKDEKDRRPWFFFLMFIFLSAMYGIVLSNDMVWMFFFWEITTLCSFALIGYTKTEEAVNNSFRQLILNLIGGIAFLGANIVLADQFGILELDKLLASDSMAQFILLAVALLCLAGIVKSAQMPFHTWLLGAMVAPTPTSALLHSSTMVKAGVFLLLKLSPLLYDNIAGYMVMTVGGVTFLLASMAAISQSNAKRVLAYSTIANLGLIVACAGIGTPEAAWAGIMLTIFHAVTKSLLFLCVGTAEHHIGSRDIEDMDFLFDRMPRLARIMLVGIAAMFLAPFGMLISKWAALTAFVDSQYVPIIICIVFGSAVTSFYWTKWMGKLAAVASGKDNVERTVHSQEWFVLESLLAIAVIVCVSFPVISEHSVIPWLIASFGSVSENLVSAISCNNKLILLFMLLALILLIIPFFGRSNRRIVPNYLSGVGIDNSSYTGSMGATVNVGLRNWYMTSWFGENIVCRAGVIVTLLAIIVPLVLITGGWFL